MKNKNHCIPEEKIDEMVIAMYLNILEYVPDDERQKELMGKLKMATKSVRLIESIKERGLSELFKKAIKHSSAEELARVHGMDVSEVKRLVDLKF